MRVKKGANYALMELGGRRETELKYSLECPLRGFYTVGPVAVEFRILLAIHREKEIHLYDDFLVFPKMEDVKDAL